MRSIVVVGAGPSGMMAAIKAAEGGASVVILEKMERAGKKMAITGKGRCNITNIAAIPEIIKNIPGNGKFLHSALRFFDNGEVIRFFEEQGVTTKVERGGRVFPASDRAADAVGALVGRIHDLGVALRVSSPVREVIVRSGVVRGVTLASGEVVAADAVILATGGASYPKTGSTGDGARIASALGHTVTPLIPALVPLETNDEWVKELSGLSLKNVRVRLMCDGKKLAEDFGEMMFTHFGVTGPVILSLSRMAARCLAAGGAPEVVIDLKPALTEERLDERIKRDFEKYSGKSLKNASRDLLPARMIPQILDIAYLDPAKNSSQVTRAERARLVSVLKNLVIPISMTRPIDEAIVTAGGVSVRETAPKTMASRLVKGLYFAGEILDIDGLTGGYNLQAAFSTGAAAGFYSALG